MIRVQYPYLYIACRKRNRKPGLGLGKRPHFPRPNFRGAVGFQFQVPLLSVGAFYSVIGDTVGDTAGEAFAPHFGC
jgi:hypothetical protein